jgi:SAM-dependent methyltransferase
MEYKQIWNSEPYKIILSNPTSKTEEYQKIVMNRLDKGYQLEKYTKKQVFHENLSCEEAEQFLAEALRERYRQCNAWDGEQEHTIRISKKGKATYQKKRTAQAPKVKQEHNRKKNYILMEGTVIPPLVDMGIFTAEGKVVRTMYDKYKQINRFVEMIDDEIDNLPKDQTITVIDFGCGKSYLTFILYYYLVELKKLDVRIIGLDLKADVIENCNQAAKKYGYDHLKFELGDINGYQCPYPVDMVISLHACDTATDYALYNAICWKAKLIFSVPCCQHELNRQMKSEDMAILTRYGIVQERVAALMTDAIRANLLIESGYKTQLLEFVDLSHTPKNILIRAVRTMQPRAAKVRVRQEVEALKAQFGFEPTLDRLLTQTKKGEK